MNCIKCGQETESGGVFCNECLEDMERNPVKPGTVVLLPPRQAESVPKKAPRKRQPPTTEELLQKYRRRTRVLFGIWIFTLALALLLGYAAHSAFEQLGIQKFWGQNYTSINDGVSPPSTPAQP